MSCYSRHVKNILNEADVAVAVSNKKQIDKVYHEMVGVTHKDCPTTWIMLKQSVISDDQRQRKPMQKLQVAIH
jgi:hypothetical protein